ncbi:MAG: toll/interleukin-1 receptor domain-containing protein [Acidobacteria bacterium]|nr:toll/interleukin-1 receptor domain-containing protein [Acidobacteriota bacterium]
MGTPRRGRRRVFISHASIDAWVARQIARGIGRSGAQPFLDETEIQAGLDFETQILAFLKKADELVALLTPWSLERPYLWAELGAAWIGGIPIIALLHGVSASDLQSRPGVPVFLRARNWRPLNDVDLYLAELRGRQKAMKERRTDDETEI